MSETKILIYGDLHLSSKAYGAHRDYPKESLEYLNKITSIAKLNNVDYIVGLGDFTFGRFHSLEYRAAIEKELEEQARITNGNHFELKGNHDEAGYGLTERDFYISKGLLKEPCNLTFDKVNISMINYGKLDSTDVLIDDNKINIALAHDFFKFSTSNTLNFGKAIELDFCHKLFGLDYLVCGHVHKIMEFTGNVFNADKNLAHELKVKYLGCMMRPAYRDGYMDDHGELLLLTITEDELNTNIINVPLWELKDSFNLELKQEEYNKKADKDARVDISDVVKQLDTHDRNIGSPEDIIAELKDIPEKYKNKAINLLKNALA